MTPDTLMARKIANYQARRQAEAKKKSKELTPKEKYNYLMKKDWDEDVIVDDGKWLATDLRGQKSLWFKELIKLPYNSDDYLVTEPIAKEARKKMKKLLKVPTQSEYEKQRNVLEGEQHANWVDSYSQFKKHLGTEVMLHQVTNVFELGWEPATESRPGQLS